MEASEHFNQCIEARGYFARDMEASVHFDQCIEARGYFARDMEAREHFARGMVWRSGNILPEVWRITSDNRPFPAAKSWQNQIESSS